MSDRAEKILKPFEENKAYMEDRIASGIEANRKGLAQLVFVDKDGNPVPNVHVEVRQKTHDFRFGANCFMLDELETDEKNEEYKKRFKELFNLATIPFYWSDLEPEQGKPRFSKDSPKIYRRPAPDLCLEFCDENGIEPKLHCLNYDQWTPLWVKDEPQTVKKYLDKRIKEIAEHYADRIPGMEVINETLCPKLGKESFRQGTRFFEDPDIVEWSFEHARKYLPSTELIINEATEFIWGGGYHYNRSPYYMQIQRALGRGASIDTIGMQYHMFYRAEDEEKMTAQFYNPYNLYAVMDQYADFGKPLQVTEITIPAYSKEEEDEELQAEIIRNLYRIWFSHPNMEAAIYWNVVDGYAAFAPQGDMSFGENYYHGALLRFDMTPKPAYYALKKLIHEEWNTSLSLDSGARTSVDMKGFYGEYELQITTQGKTVTKSFHLEKGSSTNNKWVIQI